jgi:hypothetical protein
VYGLGRGTPRSITGNYIVGTQIAGEVREVSVPSRVTPSKAPRTSWERILDVD